MKGIHYTWFCFAVFQLLQGPSLFCQQQEPTAVADKAIQLPEKLLTKLQGRAASLTSRLDKQTTRYLAKLSKHEARLRNKITVKDSTLAKTFFDGIETTYDSLQDAPAAVNKRSGGYFGRLDSVTTSLNFLKGNQLTDSPELQKTLGSYKELQSKLDASAQINKYLVQRRKLLQTKLQALGMTKDLQQFNKDIALYQSQINEYKNILQEPDKLEHKLLQWVQEVPTWKDFFAKHSVLGGIFALPTSGNLAAAVPPGLQTRAQVTQSLADRFGSLGAVNDLLQQRVPAAQGQLQQLKGQLSKYTTGNISGGGSSTDMPDYKVNPERSKSFWRRVYLSGGLQSQKAYSILPVTSDISLALNFKWTEKKVISVGASEKIGWGKGWKDFRLTHQGMGVKSFVDFNLKKSFWLSGGYELNYRPGLAALDSLMSSHGARVTRWSRSGLIGISKIMSLKGKVAKKTKVQVLWDFLSYRQQVQTPAFIWRIEYAFK